MHQTVASWFTIQLHPGIESVSCSVVHIVRQPGVPCIVVYGVMSDEALCCAMCFASVTMFWKMQPLT